MQSVRVTLGERSGMATTSSAAAASRTHAAHVAGAAMPSAARCLRRGAAAVCARSGGRCFALFSDAARVLRVPAKPRHILLRSIQTTGTPDGIPRPLYAVCPCRAPHRDGADLHRARHAEALRLSGAARQRAAGAVVALGNRRHPGVRRRSSHSDRLVHAAGRFPALAARWPSLTGCSTRREASTRS